MVGWSDFSFKYCCIIGVTFSVGLFLTAAALISLGTLVIGSFLAVRCVWWRRRVRPCGGARGKAAILPLSARALREYGGWHWRRAGNRIDAALRRQEKWSCS